jgi:glucose-6-phosphate 1-dehydrogenase
MVSTVIPVQPFDLVIFGATGDLSHRKILPSLYRSPPNPSRCAFPKLVI